MNIFPVMKIKNIILDLGGVLLNINYENTIREFKKLGIDNFEELYTQANQSKLFDKIEKGEITAKAFIAGLKDILPNHVTEQQIIHAWNSMLLDLPAERLDFLKELNQKYNTVLLSNTNVVHLEYFHKELKEVHKIDSLQGHFNKLYFSCDLKMRKPDEEIFHEVCNRENYHPDETLFIDDSIQHVEGAKKTGIHSFLLDTQKDNVIRLVNSLLTEFNQ